MLTPVPTVIAESTVRATISWMSVELVRARLGTSIIVDLSLLEFIDGAALRTIETLCSRCRARGVDVIVVASAETPVGRIVGLHRLDETVTVVESADVAVAAIGPRLSIGSAA